MLPDRESPDFIIRLKQFCDFNKITFKDIAAESKLSRTTIQLYSLKHIDKKLVPSQKTYDAIVKALETLIEKHQLQMNANYKSIRTQWQPSSPYYKLEN